MLLTDSDPECDNNYWTFGPTWVILRLNQLWELDSASWQQLLLTIGGVS